MELITLIASHLDCRKRLNLLIKLLKTISHQIDYFDEIDIRISISHCTEIAKEEIDFLLKGVISNLKIYFQEKKMSQFEHYQKLISELNDRDGDNIWILFSDDDDEWSNNRLGAYHHMINCVKEDENTMYICYTNEENVNEQVYLGNYVDYCVKLKYLRIFFKSLNDLQLKHKYCDRYLVKFLHIYKNDLKRAFCATDETLYYWKRQDHSYENTYSSTFDEAMMNNLDFYMGRYFNNSLDDWIEFCSIDTERDNKIEINDQVMKYLVNLYKDNYERHIFHDNNILTIP